LRAEGQLEAPFAKNRSRLVPPWLPPSSPPPPHANPLFPTVTCATLTVDFLSRVTYLLQPGLPWVRTIGSPGPNGTTPGLAPQFNSPEVTTAAPWAEAHALVPDQNNNRVLEVDVVQGLLVRVVATDVVSPAGVAGVCNVLFTEVMFPGHWCGPPPHPPPPM
jgi:hypothetical protein